MKSKFKNIFSQSWLILYVNVALFFYAVSELLHYLMVYPNFFSSFLKQMFTNLSFIYYNNTQSLTNWRNLVFIALLVIVIGLLVRFWRFSFVLLECIGLFVLADFAFLYFNKTIGLQEGFMVAVLIVSLLNIWQNSRQLGLL